jgi:hypothetical protein
MTVTLIQFVPYLDIDKPLFRKLYFWYESSQLAANNAQQNKKGGGKKQELKNLFVVSVRM